ncbi:glycosyltransferase family 4 protein [Streptomyces chiangmaiensis]|uniref:D-inositol 3-phosphate glycosyltransferase n=1 Tax=Streptomyces chiangmaiensis TaxID=766497 RepID=A0ABU7FTN2_9ACTN|nr:glycosyltransferase family 4 protein [Streptomyces chiangmaiensis]MED7827466.1 glycosyltransferase family 4 protein [Streptomyces chiangmaiensis]
MAAVLRCLRILLSAAPDAVYLPVSQWGIPLARDVLITMLARAAGATRVLHLHGAQLPDRLASSRLLRSALSGARWIVLSEEVAAQLRSSGCRTRSITVVRNPAPLTVTSRRPGPPGVLRVGWLGTMCRAKGFDVLCDAVEMLKGRGVQVDFRVAGMRLDVSAADMSCVDEDLGVLERADVTSFWAQVDAFVLPARWAEGLPFVLLEGLQAGCAVGATPSSGCAELFSQGCVDPVEATVNSVANFLMACRDDLQGIRSRQQKAWAELRGLYEPESVERSFVRFWEESQLAQTS